MKGRSTFTFTDLRALSNNGALLSYQTLSFFPESEILLASIKKQARRILRIGVCNVKAFLCFLSSGCN